MKDTFATRARATFHDLLAEFVESLNENEVREGKEDKREEKEASAGEFTQDEAQTSSQTKASKKKNKKSPKRKKASPNSHSPSSSSIPSPPSSLPPPPPPSLTPEAWVEIMETPLAKTKYSRAVTSVLSSPALAFHALAYRDFGAFEASTSALAHLLSSARVATLPPPSLQVVYTYLDELSANAFKAHANPVPRGPAGAENAAENQRRKEEGSGGKEGERGERGREGREGKRKKNGGDGTTNEGSHDATKPMLKHGLGEVWRRLCESRRQGRDKEEVQQDESTTTHTPSSPSSSPPSSSSSSSSSPPSSLSVEAVAQTLHALSSERVGNVDFVEACKQRRAAAAAKLVGAFPCLEGRNEQGDDATSALPLFSDEEWMLVNRATSLATMQASIPSAMMRGIEDVAAKIMLDMQAGKLDFASLDLESLGKTVLSDVGTDDMNAFAGNLDKIIAAIQHI